jgi:hypothetical protein
MVAWGVACASDGPLVLRCFVWSPMQIGSKGTDEGKLDTPSGVALLPDTGESRREARGGGKLCS